VFKSYIIRWFLFECIIWTKSFLSESASFFLSLPDTPIPLTGKHVHFYTLSLSIDFIFDPLFRHCTLASITLTSIYLLKNS